MKKIYKIFALAMIGCLAVNAQSVKSSGGLVDKRLSPKSKSNTVARHSQPGVNRTNAISYWTDDFSVPSNWTFSHSLGTSDWSIDVLPPQGPNNIGTIRSATAANNFALFDSDAYCDSLHGQVADLTLANPVNMSGHSTVRLHFSQFYRRFMDSTFVFISNNNTTWTKFEVNQSYANGQQTKTNPDIQLLDISSVAANQDSVYIRFEFYSDTSLSSSAGCGFEWMIDDVSLDSIPAVDALPPPMFPGEYTIIPIIQPEAFKIGGRIFNNGSTPISGAKLKFFVIDNTLSTVLTDSSAVASTIQPGDTSAFMPGLNGAFYTATAFGEYQFIQSVMLANDEDAVNDTSSEFILVNDSIYAHDEWENGGSLADFSFGFFSGAGYMGEIFHINHISDITSASFLLEDPAADDSVRVVVYSVTGGVPTNNQIASSDYYYTTAADSLTGIYMTLPLSNPVHAAAGADYLVAVQQVSTGKFMTLGACNNIFTPRRVFAKSTGATTWSSFENNGPDFRVSLVISLNNPAGSINGINEVQKTSAFSIYPNPTSGIVYVTYNGNSEKNVTLNVVDALGKVVKSTYYDSFSNSQLNLSSLPAGIYTINIRSNSGEENKVIVLK